MPQNPKPIKLKADISMEKLTAKVNNLSAPIKISALDEILDFIQESRHLRESATVQQITQFIERRKRELTDSMK